VNSYHKPLGLVPLFMLQSVWINCECSSLSMLSESLVTYLVVFFHSCTVHFVIIKVFYLPTEARRIALKRILKFTLKQLLHVSVQSSSSGSV